MGGEAIRLGVVFTGRVQGVGFRATTRETAREFAVTGWVRNEPDGSVRCEVQGEASEVERFLEALGLRMAGCIEGRREEPMPASAGESGFGIRY
jgi:acylphosphatase